MSSIATNPSLPKTNKEDADRVLANLARTTRTALPEPFAASTRSPEPFAASMSASAPFAASTNTPAPVLREVAMPITAEPESEPIQSGKPIETVKPVARKSRGTAALPIFDKSFEINLGKGFKMLTVRIPNEKHAHLFLMAAQNKLSGNGQPKTLNDLIMRAVDQLLADAA